jgi:ABC-2 type transport system permease protein
VNLYFRELKAHRKALFFWSIAMIFLVASGIAKFAAYSANGQSIATIVNQFPKTVQTIFGLSGFDLSKASGYYGVLFLYIALMGAVHAVLLGSEIISKEERDRTSEFLFARPLARARAVTAKLLAGLTNLVVINIVTLLSSIYFIDYFTKGQDITRYIVLLMASLFMLQLIFFSIGTAVAGFVKKPKAAASIASSVLMATFLLMFLINLNGDLDFLKYLTPFKYYDALTILVSNSLSVGYIVLSTGLVVAATYATYYFYAKRDLSV